MAERADMPTVDVAGQERRRGFGYRVRCKCGREIWASFNTDSIGEYLWARPHNTPEKTPCPIRALPARYPGTRPVALALATEETRDGN